MPSRSDSPVPQHTVQKNEREVEWQLASNDLAAVRRWLDGHGIIDGLTVEPRPTLQICDTYFDTDDWRMYRAGFALRVRVEAGKKEVTLKSLRSASAEVADRRELSEMLESTGSTVAVAALGMNGSGSESIKQLKGPVGTRVQAVSGVHSLQALFEVHTLRQRYAVHAAGDAQQLGEIALDETVISPPCGAPRASLQRVEVEALTHSHEPLRGLVKALRSGCALESATDSKYSQGLKSVGLAPTPGPEFAPTAVESSMGVGEIALAYLRRYLSAWHSHEPRARLGDDPEALHDLRVAGRKLDAILNQFEAYLPAGMRKIRSSLKKTLQSLGQARDLDVALLELACFTRQLPEADRSALEPLRTHLAAERAAARINMLTRLDSERLHKDFAILTRVLAQPSETSSRPPSAVQMGPAPNSPPQALDAPAEPAPQQIPTPGVSQLLRSRYKKVRKKANRLTGKATADDYHEVRAQVKKLRYALETVAVLFGKPADELARALRRWQEKLGIQHDAHVAGRRLRALALKPPEAIAPETLFVMGRFAARYSDIETEARKRYERAYRKVRKRWKTLKSKLQESPSSAVSASSRP